MTRELLIAAATAAVIVAAVVAGGGGGDRAGSAAKGGPVVLRLANANGDARELQPFVDAVARRSGGTLRIEVRNRWRGGDAGAEAGLVQMSPRARRSSAGAVPARSTTSESTTSTR